MTAGGKRTAVCTKKQGLTYLNERAVVLITGIDNSHSHDFSGIPGSKQAKHYSYRSSFPVCLKVLTPSSTALNTKLLCGAFPVAHTSAAVVLHSV